MNRVFLLIPCFVFALLAAAYAGEIYTYTDKDGNTVISNTPIPEKYEKKAKKIESYKRDSPEEIQRYWEDQKAKEQMREAEYRQNQQINREQGETPKQPPLRAVMQAVEMIVVQSMPIVQKSVLIKSMREGRKYARTVVIWTMTYV